MLSTTTTSTFFTIPPELQIQILRNLDAVSLFRCTTTCAYLNETIKNSSQLTYIIQLHWDGLKDCPMPFPIADSVALLLQRRQAWLALDWIGSITLELPNFHGYEYDVVGGVLAYAYNDNLEIVQLPTSRNDKGSTVRRALIGATDPCFIMDPTQDLVAFVESAPNPSSMSDSTVAVARIHIRTISGGVPHPLAFQSSLEFNVQPGLPSSDNDLVLQIAHNILALSFAAFETRMLIWDWTTSELLLDSAISFDPSLRGSYLGRCSICLLDSIYFLFAYSNDSGSIRLYKLERSLSVADAPVVHLATLHFPTLSPGSDIGGISIRTGPIQAHSLPNTAFMINDEDRLHILRIMYYYGDEDGGQSDDEATIGLMFIHQRVLTKYIAQHARLGGPALDVPWVEWGPLNTRLICPADELDSGFVKRYIHGQRAAFPGRGLSSTSIEVFDFSLAAVLSAKGRLPTPPTSSTDTDHCRLSLETLIDSFYECPFFVDDFTTYLPYVHITRDVGQKYSAMIVYADGLICVKNNDYRKALSHVYAI